MNLKNVDTCEHVTDPGMFSPLSLALSLSLFAQWDAINEMDEYFSPIHTYQVCNILSVRGLNVLELIIVRTSVVYIKLVLQKLLFFFLNIN